MSKTNSRAVGSKSRMQAQEQEPRTPAAAQDPQKQPQQEPLSANSVSNRLLTRAHMGDDFLLASLMESGFIVGSIKTVFERGKQQSFQSSIDKFNERLRREIQAICGDNYEHFLRSVNQLKIVRTEAKVLNAKITEVNDEIQTAGKLALEKGKELLSYRRVSENISSCMKLMEQCRFASSLCKKVIDLKESKKFYAALVSLGQLEHELKSQRYADFEFVRFFERSIADQRMQIRILVETEFNDWLQQSKNTAQQIGMLMMNMTQNRMLLASRASAAVRSTKQEDIEKEQTIADPAPNSFISEFTVWSTYEEGKWNIHSAIEHMMHSLLLLLHFF